MDRLYTPWRRGYVSSLRDPQGCVLCSVQQEADEEVRILHRGEAWYVILNKYPYTSGHLMVVARDHIGSLDALDPAARGEGMDLLARSEVALRSTYQPQGLNVGLNLGRAGGAGVEGHVHWHALPRWAGDANFISVVGDTRVLPETLDESYARLRPAFEG